MRLGTLAVHAGQRPDPSTGAIMTPIYCTSTYVQEYPATLKDGYDYSRGKNPTRTALQDNLAALEGGARLFIYPLERGVLLALGATSQGGEPLRPEAVLRRRGADLRRFGVWLPALFADGSCYLVRRCAESETKGLDDDEWLAAEELLR